MSQFGPKNPAAWARPPGPGQQLSTGLFQNPLVGQAFGGVAQMGMPGMINASAFSQQAAANMSMNLGMLSTSQQAIRMQAAQQQQSQQKNRTFSGVVTKMHDSFGFVDDDVFFQVSVVRGALPRSGDRVMVEATYNPSMPFKWNAYRVQLISPEKSGPSVGGQHMFHQQQEMRGRQPVPPPRGAGGGSVQNWSDKGGQVSVASMNDMRQRARSRSPPAPSLRRARSPQRMSGGLPSGGVNRRPSPPRRTSPPRTFPRRGISPKRSPMRRGPSPLRSTPGRKHDALKRERSPTNSLRNKSPSLKREGLSARGSTSPPRRRARIIPRYQCYLPKVPISASSSTSETLAMLRKRYPNLYIPSDFTKAVIEWPGTTPIENTVSFTPYPVTFHVLHKDIDCPKREVDPTSALSPPDMDPRYSAKVILLSHGGISAVHQKAFGLLSDGSIDENGDPTPLSRCISFLVGTRGKNELMPLGGCWSPSLDGLHPESDTQVLVRTAIRTVRALTGVDLSNCPRWYKLAQLCYYRADKDRLDTTVLFLPDTSGLMPSDADYRNLEAVLKNQLATKISAIEALTVESQSSKIVGACASGTAPEVTTTPVTTTSNISTTTSATTVASTSAANGESAIAGGAAAVTTTAAVTSLNTSMEQVVDNNEEEDDDEDDLTPTYWKQLDIKVMKVAELRQELMARDLETKGVKSVLCARLQEALDKERAKEENKTEEKEEEQKIDSETEKKEEAPRELTEEEKKAIEKLEKEKKERKASLERHFVIPRETGILVFPDRHAKGGRFDCKVLPLHSLLEYRIEDSKEHSFELAIFAESLSEMIDRSHSFEIYKCLSQSLDKDSEKKRRDAAKLSDVEGAEGWSRSFCLSL
ncbi:hypothetical protein AB6A40_004821 [Gnathostoma spinigerum]|uniref:SAP domain-containing protein n=1 Tax=Gnathostoma spinigerum TaxID=75299 RepID=A0ABD6ENI5_9BILA